MKKQLGLALAVIALPGTLYGVPAAHAGGGDDPVRITAHPSDKTPASGQSFTVRGRFWEDDEPADNEIVRIQRRVGDDWQNLPGARERTDNRGRYSLRIDLGQEGRRLLRAVGVTDDRNEPNAHKRFVVTVH